LVVQPAQVGQDHGGLRLPGHAAQRGEVGHHGEVAVPPRPRRHRVSVDGVHLDVDGEQVVAALGAVRHHLVQEMLGIEPLALQPPLHVGDRHEDRIHVVLGDGDA
jgi:hypothetical protein